MLQRGPTARSRVARGTTPAAQNGRFSGGNWRARTPVARPRSQDEVADAAASLVGAVQRQGGAPSLAYRLDSLFSTAASRAHECPAAASPAADALLRSPLMLALPEGHPGLEALDGVPEEYVLQAVVRLVRAEGLLDAKRLVTQDAAVLLDWMPPPGRKSWMPPASTSERDARPQEPPARPPRAAEHQPWTMQARAEPPPPPPPVAPAQHQHQHQEEHEEFTAAFFNPALDPADPSFNPATLADAIAAAAGRPLRAASPPAPTDAPPVAHPPPPAAAAAAAPSTVVVRFAVPAELKFGEHMAVAGDAPELGGWSPLGARRLDWADGNVWAGDVEIDASRDAVEFKFVVLGDDGDNEWWEPGGNRRAALPPPGHALIASAGGWGAPECNLLVVAPPPPAAAPDTEFGGAHAIGGNGVVGPDVSALRAAMLELRRDAAGLVAELEGLRGAMARRAAALQGGRRVLARLAAAEAAAAAPAGGGGPAAALRERRRRARAARLEAAAARAAQGGGVGREARLLHECSLLLDAGRGGGALHAAGFGCEGAAGFDTDAWRQQWRARRAVRRR
ncbi:MAG: hypothetical protein J3K34DRAFT_521882 [Monoraphidium minutum]|nr:MAG: hypothetical protein J3K34DRAFT_521882 [Monoraphidium minutum]